MLRIRMTSVAIAALLFLNLLAGPAFAAAPVLTLVTPVTGNASTDDTPTFTGTSDCTQGNCSDITVTIHSGPTTGGAVAQTLTTPRTSSWTVTAASLADGTYTATASQTRSGGAGGTTVTPPTTFLIDRTGPTVAFAAGGESPAEGATVGYNYSIDDGSGVGTITSVSVSCGSGSIANATNDNTSGSFDCTWVDGPDPTTVSAQATDSLGNTGSNGSKAVSIANVAPSVSLTGDTGVTTELTYTYVYSIDDPGSDTVGSVDPDCGTGSLSNATNDDTGGSFDCTFPTPGDVSVSVSATDSDGDQGATDALDVTVSNASPVADPIDGEVAVDEGSSGNYSVTASDPESDPLSYSWSLSSSDAVFEGSTNGSSVRVAFPNGPAEVDLAVDVSDDQGNSVTEQVTISIANVAPSVTLDPGETAPVEGSTNTYGYTFEDPADTVTPTPDCGTGVVSNETVTAGGGSFDCTFSEPGPTAVAIGVSDGDGGEDGDSLLVVVTPLPDPDPDPDPSDSPTPDPDPSDSPTPDPDPSESPTPAPPPGPRPPGGGGGGGGPAAPPVSSDNSPPVATGGPDTDLLSPNEDGRSDEMTFAASFSEPTNWVFEVLMDGEVVLVLHGGGTEVGFLWDGIVDGEVLPDGSYTWRLSGRDASGNSMPPLEGTFVIDTTAPEPAAIDIVQPARENRKRRVRKPLAIVKVDIPEAAVVGAAVLRGKHVVARLGSKELTEPGTAVFRWTGRNARNRPARNGNYSIVVILSDHAGNRRVVRVGRVHLRR